MFNYNLHSYNSRGFSKEKAVICNKLLSDNISILGIREHFLLGRNISKIKNLLCDHSVIGQSAVKDNNNQNSGRPKGGLCMVIPKNWRNLVTTVKTFMEAPSDNHQVQQLKRVNNKCLPSCG